MNVALEQTEEYVDGQLKMKYGDSFIRGNNILYISTQKKRKPAAGKDEDVTMVRCLLFQSVLIPAALVAGNIMICLCGTSQEWIF